MERIEAPPERVKMRRPLGTCGGQPFLLRAGGAPRAGRYFDPTFAAGVRASAAKAISARVRAARFTPGPAARAWCDERYLSPTAFGPPRSHACARMSGTADRHRGVARRLRSLAVFRTNRHSASPRLAGEVTSHSRACSGFISIGRQSAGVARKRTFARAKALRIPRSAGPFTRAPLEAGVGARHRVTRRKACSRPGSRSVRGRFHGQRGRTKTPVTRLTEVAEAGSAP
jgi:hypothetical protein